MPENRGNWLALEEPTEAKTTGVAIWLNAYLQVAWTYVRRPFSSPPARAVSILFLFMCIGPGLILLTGGGRRPDVAASPICLQMPLMLAMFLFTMFAFHVKSQFADWRAHLTPRFRRVHATVAALAALLLSVVVPLALTWLAGMRSVGPVALVALLFGAILWTVALNSRLCSWLVAVGFFSTFAEPARVLLWQVLSGRFEAQAVALLALGVALALVAGIRLFGLDEDMPEYHQYIRTGWAGQYRPRGGSPAGLAIFPAALRERSSENTMTRLTNHARRASMSRWSRVCRWQAGFPAGWSAFFMVFLAVVTVTISVSGQDWRSGDVVFPIIMMFSFMPPCMFWGFFRRWRVPMLAHELLLPVGRRSFVRQVGMAAAVDQFRVWAGMSIGLTLWVLLVGPEAFSLTTLAVLLGVIALLQFWVFGVGAWFVRCRSLGVQLAGFALAVYVPMIPGALCAATGPLSPWRYMALPLAGIAALSGLLLTCDAYRRWLAADLG